MKLSPFMGFDTIQPYLRYLSKGLFLLCRTSGPGRDDFQFVIIQPSTGH